MQGHLFQGGVTPKRKLTAAPNTNFNPPLRDSSCVDVDKSTSYDLYKPPSSPVGFVDIDGSKDIQAITVQDVQAIDRDGSPVGLDGKLVDPLDVNFAPRQRNTGNSDAGGLRGAGSFRRSPVPPADGVLKRSRTTYRPPGPLDRMAVNESRS